MGKKTKARKPKQPDPFQGFNFPFIPDATFDFHDLGPVTGYDIEKYINEFLEDRHVLGNEKLLLITGKGNVVRPLAEKILARHKLVKSFKRAGYFNGQSGAFEIWLND